MYYKHETGKEGENIATKYLEQNGYEFVGEDQGVVYYLRVNDENKDYRRIAM